MRMPISSQTHTHIRAYIHTHTHFQQTTRRYPFSRFYGNKVGMQRLGWSVACAIRARSLSWCSDIYIVCVSRKFTDRISVYLSRSIPPDVRPFCGNALLFSLNLHASPLPLVYGWVCPWTWRSPPFKFDA